MRPFLFAIAILAGSAVLVFLFLTFAAASLNFLSTLIIVTTAAVVISIIAGRWLWIHKHVHPLHFAFGIVLCLVIVFILYMVFFSIVCC
jgi:hypothetical protein